MFNLVWCSLVFIGFNCVVYWLTGELRDRYLYPFLPLVVILLGYIVMEWEQQLTFSKQWIYLTIPLVVLATLILTFANPLYVVFQKLVHAGIFIGLGFVLYRYVRSIDLKLVWLLAGIIIIIKFTSVLMH